MANEKRLIDANAIEAKIEKSFRNLIANQSRPDLAAALSYVGDLIIEAPTVDALEVVRCKDCKHCSVDTMFGSCWCHGFSVKLDHFCSYGERREGT